jgi:hypothetical protein
MANLTAEQIEQKKQQLKQLSEEMNALVKELQEAGVWPLDDDDLDQAAGGIRYADLYVYQYDPYRADDGTGPSDEQLQAQQEYMNNHPHKFLKF